MQKYTCSIEKWQGNTTNLSKNVYLFVIEVEFG